MNNYPTNDSPLLIKKTIKDGGDEYLNNLLQSYHRDGFIVFQPKDPNFIKVLDNIKEETFPFFSNDIKEIEEARKDNPDAPGVRLQDGWNNFNSIKKLACHPEILSLLKFLYGREAFPFQTLNFPNGTQQHFHSDAIHFSSFPNGFMCGVWVALEDIEEGSGLLEYFPGSHKFPYLHYSDVKDLPLTKDHGQEIFYDTWNDLLEFYNIKKQLFHAKKGDCLIWHANLIHGGSEVTNPTLTRWSQVSHYYFKDCLYYTPLLSYWPNGELAIREPLNISTGKKVEYDTLKLFFNLTGFNKDRYLKINPDVEEAGIDALLHWLTFGLNENRKFK